MIRHEPPWIAAAPMTASTTVRSVDVVRNMRFDITS
jgi:hypothetical protein